VGTFFEKAPFFMPKMIKSRAKVGTGKIWKKPIYTTRVGIDIWTNHNILYKKDEKPQNRPKILHKYYKILRIPF